MVVIETRKLVIRNFKTSDWEALLDTIRQYESSEFAAYDHQWPTSPEGIKQVTERFASGDSFLAVCLKETGRLMGLVSLHQEQKADRREFNIGYVFNFDYHGQGYAMEACRAAMDHAFDRMQADRVVSATAAANMASWRLLERLGLRRTAKSRGSLRSTAEGKPIEFLGYTYAISKEEWATAVQDEHPSNLAATE